MKETTVTQLIHYDMGYSTYCERNFDFIPLLQSRCPDDKGISKTAQVGLRSLSSFSYCQSMISDMINKGCSDFRGCRVGWSIPQTISKYIKL